MVMELLSVNVGLPQVVPYKNKTATTGIFKKPVQGRVMLRRHNLDGDGQADLDNHGGIDKAVYVYDWEYYNYWQSVLGRNDFVFGQFGENFTVTGMLDHQVHIGDVFRIGEATVEVTQPRVPCYKLGIRMEIPDFPKQFLTSRRIGFYLRVLEEGKVGAGDKIERIKLDPSQMTVETVCHLLYFESDNVSAMQKVVEIEALSSGWRDSFFQKLQRS